MVETDREDTSLIRNLAVLALAMVLGSQVSSYIQSPGHHHAGLHRGHARRVGTQEYRRPNPLDRDRLAAMEFVGNLALNIFLVVALMSLKLWELAGLALATSGDPRRQVLVVMLFAATVSFRVMGKDYDSAVMASGFIGFVLGTTANAVANMRALLAGSGRHRAPSSWFRWWERSSLT